MWREVTELDPSRALLRYWLTLYSARTVGRGKWRVWRGSRRMPLGIHRPRIHPSFVSRYKVGLEGIRQCELFYQLARGNVKTIGCCFRDDLIFLLFGVNWKWRHPRKEPSRWLFIRVLQLDRRGIASRLHYSTRLPPFIGNRLWWVLSADDYSAQEYRYYNNNQHVHITKQWFFPWYKPLNVCRHILNHSLYTEECLCKVEKLWNVLILMSLDS